MLHIILCDDNRTILDQEKQYISTIAKRNQLDIKISTFPSGEALLFHAEEKNQDMDIIFLDVLMGETNGIETANKLRAIGCDAQIIFVTSSREHVFESFDSNPLHYLIKDEMDVDKIEEILLKAVRLRNKTDEMFTFKRGSATKSITLHKIKYFEIIGRIMAIHYDDEIFEYYKKIDELEAELKSKNFCRIHRSFIVNLRFINELSRSDIKLSDGSVLPIGRSYYTNVKKTISNYLSSGE